MSIERAINRTGAALYGCIQGESFDPRGDKQRVPTRISPLPVSLESNFRPLWDTEKDLEANHGNLLDGWSFPTLGRMGTPPRLDLPKQELDWNRSELFLKQLQTMSFRSGFEVAGNNKGVTIALFRFTVLTCPS